MDFLGHRFVCTKKTQDYSYHACTFKRTLNCPGTIKINRDGVIFPLRAHNNHDVPNNTITHFRQLLRRRAINERTSIRVIYDEEAERNTQEAALYPYTTAASSMAAARRRRNPPVPTTLQDLGSVLNQEKYYSTVNGIESPLYRSTIECPEGVALFFASQSLLDMLGEGVTEINLDCNFNCVPVSPPSRQLLTVHIVVQDRTIPIAYALMSSRRQEVYVRVLQELRVYASTLQPVMIISDYEKTLREAIPLVFPLAEVAGSFYHYASALWKMAARLELIQQLDTNSDMNKALKLLMGLPLLPAEQIEIGFEEIKQWCNDHLVDMQPMFDYITRFWIQTVQPEYMSVYGDSGRTNNNVEALNLVLVTYIGQRPNVFTFIEKLIKINNRAALHFEQLQQGGFRLSRPISNKYLHNDVRIRNALEAYTLGAHSILHFLELAAYALESIADEMRQCHIIGLRDHDVINDATGDNVLKQDDPLQLDEVEQLAELPQPVQPEDPLSQPNPVAAAGRQVPLDSVNWKYFKTSNSTLSLNDASPKIKKNTISQTADLEREIKEEILEIGEVVRKNSQLKETEVLAATNASAVDTISNQNIQAPLRNIHGKNTLPTSEVVNIVKDIKTYSRTNSLSSGCLPSTSTLTCSKDADINNGVKNTTINLIENNSRLYLGVPRKDYLVIKFTKPSACLPSTSITCSEDADINNGVKNTTINLIENNSRFYLGIPKKEYFLIKFTETELKIDYEKVLLTLKKIRTNDQDSRLAIDFGLNSATASSYFVESVAKMAVLYQSLIYWPDKMLLRRLLPSLFRYRYCCTQSIIDCFEIEIEVPSEPLHQVLTLSQSKKCNTIKYLISCTPYGLVNFVSYGFGGRTTDYEIMKMSGYLKQLAEHTAVMTDRLIKNVAAHIDKINRKLVWPMSTVSDKISKKGVLHSKQNASVQTHIERVIQRLREYKMLNSCVDSQNVRWLDCIVVIACAIINLQGVLI